MIFKSVLHGNRHDIQPPDIATDICKCSETISPFSFFFFFCLVVNCLSTIILLCCQHLNVIMPIILFYDSRNIFCGWLHFRYCYQARLQLLSSPAFSFPSCSLESIERSLVDRSVGCWMAVLPAGSFRLFNVGLVEVSAAFRFRFSLALRSAMISDRLSSVRFDLDWIGLDWIGSRAMHIVSHWLGDGGNSSLLV